jgi:hypothetical protein
MSTNSINFKKKNDKKKTNRRENKIVHLFFFSKYRIDIHIFEMLFLLLIIRHDTHLKKEKNERRVTKSR